MIRCRRFSAFVDEFIETINQETMDSDMWDLFLHSSAFLQETFDEFKERCKVPDEKDSSENLGAAINISRSILDDFNPEEGDELC